MRMRTLQEAADALGVSRATVRKLAIGGKIPYMKWGSRYLVDLDVVEPIFRDRNNTRNMLSTDECAEALGLAASTLRNMALAGLVPYKKKGRYMKFDLDAVIRAIRESMVGMEDGGR